MVTLIGIILLATMTAFLIMWRRHFVWFLSAMIPFPQTAMFVVAGQGISPFYAAAIAATFLGAGSLGRSLLTQRANFIPLPSVQATLLAIFTIYTVIVTLTGPILFEGMGVLSPRNGIDSQLGNLTPLSFTVSNFAQLAYLFLGVGVVVYILSLRKLNPRILEAGIWAGIAVTLCDAVMGNNFPRELFDTIPTIYYQGGGRLRGPFAEPSVLGAFLVASITYFVSSAFTTRGLQRIASFAGIFIALLEFSLSASGTTLAAGAIVGALGALLLIWRWVRNGIRGIDSVMWILTTSAAIILAFWPSLSGFLGGLVSEKLASSSFENRGESNDIGIGVLLNSFGVGVGLGSNRPSSFLVMLLSCVGIIGTLLLTGLVILSATKSIRAKEGFASIGWALLAIFVAMAIAKADLPTPMLWVSLAAAMWVNLRYESHSGDFHNRKYTALRSSRRRVERVPAQSQKRCRPSK